MQCWIDRIRTLDIPTRELQDGFLIVGGISLSERTKCMSHDSNIDTQSSSDQSNLLLALFPMKIVLQRVNSASVSVGMLIT